MAGIVAIERKSAVQRTNVLLQSDPRIQESAQPLTLSRSRKSRSRTTGFSLRLEEAGLPIKPFCLFVVSFAFATAFGLLASYVISPYFVPLLFLAGAMLPLTWVDAKANRRAVAFSEEYPTVLLAAASSIKAGMTVYAALDRTVRLLPKNSIARVEVESLVKNLSRGESREEALQNFGSAIRQADLVLFRSAFMLVLEHGGRFAPTLERLARVSRDRAILVRSARVRTASMRMTANVLLLITPIILLMISARTEDFWAVLLEHQTANILASVGLLTIGVSYVALRRMSSFKP